MSAPESLIACNLAAVRQRMAAAALRAGRNPDRVQLIAVTKYVGPELARAVVAAGCPDLGESRPQELWRKADALRDLPVRWHLIGHLQRNKIPRTLPLLTLLHSVDSVRLLDELERQSGGERPPVPVLLEINISGDVAKHGFRPAELESLVPRLHTYRRIQFRGLMAMSGLTSDSTRARQEFAAVRELHNHLIQRTPPGLIGTELSMGMSGDFEEAIEEGATMVRVGSALFEGLSE